MRPIHRAAVTGLFAVWLAPLPAAPAADGSGACCGDRTPPAARAVAERARDGAAGESREEG